MSKAVQSELRLAKRMTRLGTETAFDVLVKARVLEATGRDIVHLEIGEPISIPGQHHRGGDRRPAQGLHPLRAVGWLAAVARDHRSVRE